MVVHAYSASCLAGRDWENLPKASLYKKSERPHLNQ
jgi:hypothetical protein